MNLRTNTKVLKIVEKEIIEKDKMFDYDTIKELIQYIEINLGFKTKAQELREQYL